MVVTGVAGCGHVEFGDVDVVDVGVVCGAWCLRYACVFGVDVRHVLFVLLVMLVLVGLMLLL